ncbi:hypothetical protein J5I95_22670 [Candidatus Poribacteria bacterium]|nr:hypothetical protein [Candidatus Poribacteria bacterium]
MNNVIHVSVPRDSSPDVHRAIQQVNEGFKQLSIPWLIQYKSVQGLKEGRSAYFKDDQGRWCQYIKLNDGLYCIELQKAGTSISDIIDEKVAALKQELTQRLDDFEDRISDIENKIGTVDVVDLENRVTDLENG